ncbi:MAG: transposase [Chloroflexi bacterium]|nr:transposase [Chloroflexota bacterium]
MSQRKLRVYDKEFKLNAVKLYLNSGMSYKHISEELGIPVATLAGWIDKYQKDGVEAFPGKGNLKPADAELTRLRRELSIVQEERNILKKALGIFSSMRK